MKPADSFKKMLVETIEPSLKSHGFSRRGYTFYILQRGNWGLINFQKSNKSSPKEFIFTVNLGVASALLLKFFQELGTKPDIWDCHWRLRLGYLLEEPGDRWWTITRDTSLDKLSQEMRNHITKLAVTEVLRHLPDEALRDLWLSGKSPSLTNFERLRNLLVLLKILGPENLFEATATEFLQTSTGKPTEIVAQLHIERLKDTNSI